MKLSMLVLVPFLFPFQLSLAGYQETPPVDPIPAHETLNIESGVLGETRCINVYLPAGYAGNEERFPVLYMPDGGIKEDFPHIANSIEALISEGNISPMIVVGIENTVRRRDLTGPTEIEEDKKIAPVVGGSEAFRKFIRTELIPEIEKKYRCTDERGIVGESMAGLFVVETFFLEPELFTKYVAMSPSLWWNDHELVRKASERLDPEKYDGRTIWFTTGDETDIGKFTDELDVILSEAKLPGLTHAYQPMKEEHHHTIFRAAKVEAFKFTFAVPGKAADENREK